jgi:hypothetical protein
LRRCLRSDIVDRAKAVSMQIETRGARIAAEKLLAMLAPE